MLFNEFGNGDKAVILMDGMYNGDDIFVSFEEECEQIEEYINKRYEGEIEAVYGISQGATLMAELLARNNIKIRTAILDGLYVAHQGKLVGLISYRMFRKAKNNGGKFPRAMDIVMNLMGLSKEDYKMMEHIYWKVSDESLKNNMMKNYTYRLNPDIKNTKTNIYLMCGEKEPYAKKSNKILKQYVPNAKEKILKNMGHAKMFYFNGKELCDMLREIIR